MTVVPDLPLTGVRVLELTDGLAETTGRLLADLGADVVRLEPAGRAPRAPDLYDLTHNANKRSVTLDLVADRADVLRLLDAADLLLTDSPRVLAEADLAVGDLVAQRPGLVLVAVTHFGLTGPRRDWAATEPVHLALGGVLCRSGLPGRVPLLPPAGLVRESACAQAAWAALVAYVNRLDTGRGDLVDVAVHEATVRVLDPGYGVAGSATGGVPAADGPRGRPDARHFYPMFPCADGWVRLCVLAPRQWAGMFRWLGEPAEFADPVLAGLGPRFAVADRLLPAIAALVAPLTREEVVAQGVRHGVPTAALLTPAEVFGAEQYVARGVFRQLPLPGGGTVPVVDGLLEVDGRRAGLRTPAPTPGEHTAQVLGEWTPLAVEERPATGRTLPMTGLRVLDLGVIVVGAETGRLFADLGAEVVKVEHESFPDGCRQSSTGSGMNASFAYGNRSKQGLSIDLRSDAGRELFLQLAAVSDVVLSNFKPGTLDSLGLSVDQLHAVNPRLVIADSSAFGGTGPWSRRMGYGPLVRASTGLSELWRYPDTAGGFSDASTIYPDHTSARVEAVAVLAQLVARRRTGLGGTVSVAQAEVILGQLSTALAQEALAPGSLQAVGNADPADAPRGVYPCAGDDEWCVVTVRDDDDWARLAQFVGGPELAADPRLARADGRVAARAELDALLGAWTAGRGPQEAMEQLQAVGVPAGAMQRVTQLLVDPQLVHRASFTTMHQPGVSEPMPTEGAAALFRGVADPPLRPAPMIGEHSRAVLTRVLALSDAEVDVLVASGVVATAATGVVPPPVPSPAITGA